jgi:hypothetical protein
MRVLSKTRATLARLTARARLGPRDRGEDNAMSYRDIVWENAMEAYGSSPDPPLEMTPYLRARLDAVKQELLLKAHRTKRERDRRIAERRRRLGIVAATAMIVLSTAGATSALIDVGTGIPAVDRVLGNYEDAASGTDRSQILASDRPPETGRLSPEAPIVDLAIPSQNGQDTAGVAFTSQDQKLCYVLPAINPSSTAFEGSTVCQAPESVATAMLGDGFVLESTIADRGGVLVSGYFGPDVENLVIRSTYGPLRINMTSVWDPRLPDVGQIGVFVGVIIGDIPQDEIWDMDEGSPFDPRTYEVEAHLRDGRILTRTGKTLTQ